MPFDSNKFRQTMRLWATGVTVVAAKSGDIMRGITVSSFTSVTLEPPLVLVCIQKKTDLVQVILESGYFAVSMLGEGQEAISNIFAGFGLPDGADRFEGIPLYFATTGAPILGDAMGWLDCRLYETYDGHTHQIFVGEVVEASGQGEVIQHPLLYYDRNYRRLD
jgi:flavin reductase (DIM6/NTAB) family NADH-FMN oxidoreductase RutF